MNINEIQNWVIKFNEKQGWSNKDKNPFIDTNFLSEECGEVVREVRRLEVGRHGHNEPMTPIEMKEKLAEEIGDVLNALSTIAERYDVTLEEAFLIHKEKMEREYGSLN